jgi:hypothetical protein
LVGWFGFVLFGLISSVCLVLFCVVCCLAQFVLFGWFCFVVTKEQKPLVQVHNFTEKEAEFQ